MDLPLVGDGREVDLMTTSPGEFRITWERSGAKLTVNVSPANRFAVNDVARPMASRLEFIFMRPILPAGKKELSAAGQTFVKEL